MTTHKEVMQQAVHLFAALQEVYGVAFGPGTHQSIEVNITALRTALAEPESSFCPHCNPCRNGDKMAKTERERAILQIRVDDLQTELNVLRAQPEVIQWKPIETAPRDGTHILAMLPNSDTCYVIEWADAKAGVRVEAGEGIGWHIAWDGYFLEGFDAPIRWMHLPPDYEEDQPEVIRSEEGTKDGNPVDEPVARLLHWHGPHHYPVPHEGIAARTYAEYSKEDADKPDSYWKNGEPLHLHQQRRLSDKDKMEAMQPEVEEMLVLLRSENMVFGRWEREKFADLIERLATAHDPEAFSKKETTAQGDNRG